MTRTVIDRDESLADLTATVLAVRDDLGHAADRHAADLALVAPEHLPSARNLLHYVALRGHDVRTLQPRLSEVGLSSLGHAEGHVMATVEAVLRALRALAGEPTPMPRGDWLTFAQGRDLLAANTEALFGPPPADRATRIMVTLPSSAADDPALVRELVERGMDCARINTAHDGPHAWRQMIDNVRGAADETGRPCQVAMDLAGPKLRTTLVEGAEPPRLRVGDALLLATEPADRERSARRGVPQVGATPAQALRTVRVGHRVRFDDGKLGAVVTVADPSLLHLRVTDAPPKGARLRAGKGINLPDSELPLVALTARDLATLPFVAAHADIVALSFVRRPHDVEDLRSRLAALGRDDLGIILKIETLQGFEHLPRILLAALRTRRVGVMIARGDLAVECGYRRLAELQEEILWLCEAAHVPVIWATQVLDQLARTGRPTRAEITDAAMSERAECVMLNKGPYVADAVTLLADLLGRMGAHQDKKSALMRRLRSWQEDQDAPF
jgi:pyruvate kinase